MIVLSVMFSITVIMADDVTEPPGISAAQMRESFLTSINRGKGAHAYHIAAGCRNVDSVKPELYLRFEKHCLRCSDCARMLDNEMVPVLYMISSSWFDISGTRMIRLINREGLHCYTFTEEGILEVNNPYLDRSYVGVD